METMLDVFFVGGVALMLIVAFLNGIYGDKSPRYQSYFTKRRVYKRWKDR